MYGLDWHTACERDWNADSMNGTTSNRATSLVLILLIVAIILLILLSVVTCWKDYRKRKLQQMEISNNLELTRET